MGRAAPKNTSVLALVLDLDELWSEIDRLNPGE
jgi:hypothetical protein